MTRTWPLRILPGDLARQAVASLFAHRLRAGLSVLGIVVGIATVVTAFAIGEGARRAALSEIGALGLDNVFIQATASPAAPLLTIDDARAIAGSVSGIDRVAAARTARVEIRGGDGRANTEPCVLSGVTSDWAPIAGVDVADGRWMSQDDDRSYRRVAVLGDALAAELFASSSPIGARVVAGGAWYVVVGRLRPRSAVRAGSVIQNTDVDRTMFVPLSTMDVRVGEGDALERVHQIAVRAGGIGAERAARELSTLMARRHRGAAGYEVVVPRELLRARLRTQRTFDLVLVGIGALSLFISGVGIMNIMLASVAERVHEVGVRRAFGARRMEIVAQFAVEAGALCIAGGFAGVPLGALLSLAVSLAAGWPVRVSAPAVALAISLAFATGLTFGIYPARVAAGIQPVDALRA